jgi:Domain of unknown function (DUF4178)
MAETGKYPPGGVKTFSCPNCGGTIGIRAVGVTVSAVCESCGSVIDVANDELRIISKALEHTRKNLLLPLGARGQLFGAEWEIIGYVERGDEDSTWWCEYLLFNPWQGFRFLVESDGHWNFVKMLRREIVDATYDGKKYKLFFRDSVLVKYVMGEFYWRIKVGERVTVEDFIAPPYVLSAEYSDQDIIWSQGLYVRPEAIQAAFNIKEEWPEPTGIAGNEPSRSGTFLPRAITAMVVAMGCLVVFQVMAAMTARNQLLFDQNIHASPMQKDAPTTTEPFTIPGGDANLEITVFTKVDNDWLEVEAEFVNQDTEQRYSALETVEYYHGYDSDGSWSEGGQTSWDMLSAVPGGKYRLFITTDSGAIAKGQPSDYRLRVVRDAPEWSNFWTAFLFLFSALVVLFARYGAMEQARWANSSIAHLVGPPSAPERVGDENA